jgi:molecular chaperone GrpE
VTSSPDEQPVETPRASTPQEPPTGPDVADVTGGEPQETAAPQPVQKPRSSTPQERPAATPKPDRRPGGAPEAHPDESGSFGDDAVNDDPVEDEGDTDLAASDELILAQTALAERTLDLQRIQAEFVNYKRRVERDRELVRQNATFGVLGSLLPILDDIDRAREHGELEGGFKAVADSLERTVAALGLTKFGAKGDEFDPNIHEALMHGHSPDVTTTTVDVVAHAGYRIGDRVVRAAKVTVLDPE